MAVSKERSNAYISDRRSAGTISANIGLLQAGAAQLMSKPMQPNTAAYSAAALPVP